MGKITFFIGKIIIFINRVVGWLVKNVQKQSVRRCGSNVYIGKTVVYLLKRIWL